MWNIRFMIWSEKGTHPEGHNEEIAQKFFVGNLGGFAGVVCKLDSLASDRISCPGPDALPSLFLIKTRVEDEASVRGFESKFQSWAKRIHRAHKFSLGPDMVDTLEELANHKDWGRYAWKNARVKGIDLTVAIKFVPGLWEKGYKFFPLHPFEEHLEELGASMDPQFSVAGDHGLFVEIGGAFVTHYYSLYDRPLTRAAKLVTLYSQQGCYQTFEGSQAAGQEAIKAKLTALTFQRIQRRITSVDCQPLPDGIMVVVLGQLRTDEDQPQSYVETFILRATSRNFFITNNVFRLVLHHM